MLTHFWQEVLCLEKQSHDFKNNEDSSSGEAVCKRSFKDYWACYHISCELGRGKMDQAHESEK